LAGRWLFAHQAQDQAPGPIGDMPIERMVEEDRIDGGRVDAVR
jgi:aquaporin Z